MSFSHYSCTQSSCDYPEFSCTLPETDISGLLEMLSSIRDTRKPQARQYDLVFVLGVSVVANLAGAKGYEEISRKALDMSQGLLEKLGAKWNWFKGRYVPPSKATIRRVLTKIDADELAAIIGKWVARQSPGKPGEEWRIALDGKVLRGAWTSENDQVTAFSAMIHEAGLTIGQVRVPDGTNEITQVDELLSALPISPGEPALITIDAAHTQDETAEAITKRPKWSYLMTVKGNRPTLLRSLFEMLAPLTTGKPDDVVEEYKRGQYKKWRLWVTDASGINFPGLEQAAIIIRDTFNAAKERISKEMVIVITSASSAEMCAADINKHKRNHWGIENKSHYPRDVVYREDNDQTWQGEGPLVLAVLRSLAMSLFRLKGVKNIKETTEWVAGDRARALYFMTT
jgi:predicted transposase YbfD/YdcC